MWGGGRDGQGVKSKHLTERRDACCAKKLSEKRATLGIGLLRKTKNMCVLKKKGMQKNRAAVY